MVNYGALNNASKDELIKIIRNLDKDIIATGEKTKEIVVESVRYKEAFERACQELARACKKMDTSESWQDPKNWEKVILS